MSSSVSSWPAYRLLRRQVRWSGIPIPFRIFQFVVIHTVKGYKVVHEVDVDVFLEFPCFFYNPTDVGNLISGSFVFSKSSLYICKFLVHVLLKLSLKDFEHYLASMWNEGNCAVVWTFFGIALLWHLNGNWPFLVLWPLLSFPNSLAYCEGHSVVSLCDPMNYNISWNSPGQNTEMGSCSLLQGIFPTAALPKINYLKAGSRFTDIENKLMITSKEREEWRAR